MLNRSFKMSRPALEGLHGGRSARLSGAVLCLALGTGWALPARASDNGQASLAADALRVFLGQAEAADGGARGAQAAASAMVVSGRQVVAVQRGDSLNAIIQRVFGPAVAQNAALRKAFVQLNPAAFVGGNPNRLVAGVVLQVPQPEDLGAGRQALPSAHGSGAVGAVAVPEDRRNWVRFP